MSRVVSVWARWGDYALGVRDLRAGETLRVGLPPRRLVRCGRRAVTLWDEGAPRTLKPGESVTIEREGVEYSVSCADGVGREGFAAARPWRELLTLVAGLGLVTVGLVLEREHPERWREHFVGFAQLPLPRMQDSAPAPEVELSVASEPQSSALRSAGRMRCGSAAMGQRVANLGGRYGVAGPKDNPDPRLTRPDVGTGFPTTSDGPVVGVRGLGPVRVPVGSNALTAPWGRQDQLGIDEQSARGQMWGELIADAWGDDGLGLAVRPGGVLKRIDVAATSAEEQALRVVHTGLSVVGPRKQSEVGRAMSALFEGFQGCAAQAAVGEQRRVELAFEVLPDGQVQRGASERDALEACLDARLASAKFAPGAAAVAMVRYPLYFVPAAGELRSVPVTPSGPPAPCACGG